VSLINPDNINKLKNLVQHPALTKPFNAYAKQEYATPLFVLRETIAGFLRHNVFGMSASLSFYALFALIPLILLIFFLQFSPATWCQISAIKSWWRSIVHRKPKPLGGRWVYLCCYGQLHH
jgi:hypothetical protein